MPNLLELLDSYIISEDKNNTFNVIKDQDIKKNTIDMSINLNEANSSTPKVQFNIGDSANHPVASVTPLESEVDSGFISSEAEVVPELCKGLIDSPNNVKFADEDEFEEVGKLMRKLKHYL